MKTEGTIKNIVPSKQDLKRLSLLVDKAWFSLFTKDGNTDLVIGDVIEFDYVEKGMFKNINEKTLKKIGKNVITEMVHDNRSDTSNRIEKQATLKASALYSKSAEENIKNAKILYKSLKEDW